MMATLPTRRISHQPYGRVERAWKNAAGSDPQIVL